MYESDRGMSGLHPDTLRRMRELFSGHVCSVCQVPATRLRGEQYYCHEHHPHSHDMCRSPRVYKCQLTVEA